MHSEIVYGFGFSVPAHNPDLFKRFILNHQKAIEEQGTPEEKKLLNTAKFDKNYSFDYDDVDEDFLLESTVNQQEGPHAIIGNVIQYETCIRMQYEPGDGDTDSDPAIIFARGYPWELNATEKDLQEESFRNLLYKYLRELDSAASVTDIDTIRIEYYC